MRAVVLLVLLAGCGRDVCADLDGTCVALEVHGQGMADGQIDGLDITLAGAATGRQIAPEFASIASLPVSVALEVPTATAGVLAVHVVAVREGTLVGGGDVSIAIKPGQHVTAAVTLGVLADDAGLTAPVDLACPADRFRCGGTCCSSASEICANGACTSCGTQPACVTECCTGSNVCKNGQCVLPYQTAKAVVYLCPDYGNGCVDGAFMIGSQCSNVTSPTAGRCYTTGLDVEAGMSYGISACTSCNTSCSTNAQFMTPAEGFAQPTYYTQISFYCQTPCTAPVTCP
jgi:hypothetical protein